MNIEYAYISFDGCYVAFSSSNDHGVGGPSTHPNVFVRDTHTGGIIQVEGSGVSSYEFDSPQISDDGRFVSYLTGQLNVADLATGERTVVSRRSGVNGAIGNGGVQRPHLR